MRNDQFGRGVQIGRYVGDPTTLALTVTTDRVQLSPNRYYRLWSSVDAFFSFGDGTVVATTTSNPLTGTLDVLHRTDKANVFMAGIVSSGSGTLFASEIEA